VLIKHGVNLKIAKVAQWDEAIIENKLGMTQASLDSLAQINPIALNPEKYLYVTARAVSGGEKHGPNDNGDYFGWEELKKRAKTFIGAAVNIDHKNSKPEWAIGIIIDAILNVEGEWVEIVMAIDKEKAEQMYPGIVDAIESGEVTDVSMGCLVDYSICNICLEENAGGDENKLVKGEGLAYDEEDYCEHVREEDEPDVPNTKFAKGGEVNGKPCYEDNRGVTFFEESVITTKGADKDAKFIARLASLAKVASKSPLVDYIIFRHLDKLKLAHLQKINKGEEQMGNGDKTKRTAAEGSGKVSEPEVAANDKQSTKPDQGDAYGGSGAQKDKALYDQAKKAAPAEGNKGSEVSTQQDKGNYLLANLKHLKEAASNDPVYVAGLLGITAADLQEKIDNEEVDAPESQTQDASSKPLVKTYEKKETVTYAQKRQADEGRKGMEEMQDDESKTIESSPDKMGDMPIQVEEGEDEAEEEDVIQAGKTAKKAKESSQQALGGKEGKPSGVTAAVKAVGDWMLAKLAGIAVSTEEANSVRQNDDPDYGSASAKDKEYASEAAGDEKETSKEIGQQNAAGNATKSEREKQVDLAKAHVGSRRAALLKRKAENEDKKHDFVVSKMAEGIAYDDAMKQANDMYDEDGGVVEKDERDSSKLGSKRQANEAESEMADGTDDTKSSPASVSEANKENDMQDKEVGQESAGSTTEKPEVERELAASKKKKADVNVEIEDEGEEEDEEEMITEADIDLDEESVEEASSETVEQLDQVAEKVEAEVNSLSVAASLMAKTKQASSAKVAVKRLASLKKIQASLDSHADKIEFVASRFASLKAAESRTKAIASIKKVHANALNDLNNIKKVMASFDNSGLKIASAQASAMLKLAQENEQQKRMLAVKTAALKKEAKRKVIAELASLARERGLEDGAVRTKIAQWNKMNDDTLAGVRIAFLDMPKVVNAKAAISRVVREAARGTMRAQNGNLQGINSPINGRSRNVVASNGAELDAIDGIFEDGYGEDGPANSF